VDTKPIVIAENKLQNKLARYYVQEGLQLKANEIYISPLDLNEEYGIVETPYKPMVRIVTPSKLDRAIICMKAPHLAVIPTP